MQASLQSARIATVRGASAPRTVVRNAEKMSVVHEVLDELTAQNAKMAQTLRSSTKFVINEAME